MKTQAACSHCNGFSFRSTLVITHFKKDHDIPEDTDLAAVWWCNKDCGYWLPWNPKDGPTGVICLTHPGPPPNGLTAWKDPPEVTSSKRG